jgi:hypothetical protein
MFAPGGDGPDGIDPDRLFTGEQFMLGESWGADGTERVEDPVNIEKEQRTAHLNLPPRTGTGRGFTGLTFPLGQPAH